MNGNMNSADVWNSPEFKALAKLIGIPLEPPTKALTIRFSFGESLMPVEVHQNYFAVGELNKQ